MIEIRPATPGDGDAIADVWLASWHATFDFPPGHPDDEVRRWLIGTLLPTTEAWVAEAGGRVVAMMALSDAMVEQLYVAPDWIGRGVGSRLIAHARERRPGGFDLYCFTVNGRARAFYERHGLEAVAFGDGSGNEERQPDIRYRWRPGPDLVVPSADGTPIAVVRLGIPDGPPILLVHGAAADHTTFRVIGPMLAARFDVHAMDRRGRGMSGDTLPYAIEREFEDVAAVVDAIGHARGPGVGVGVFGHSYGGRCALGASVRTPRLRRVIAYEGAPAAPGTRYTDAAVAHELAGLAAAGSLEELLVTFMTGVVGMTDEEMAGYRSDPVWPRRVAAAGTIARELLVEAADDEAGLEALGAVRVPVLQIQGGDSLPVFVDAIRALDARLADGQVVVIEGARHAAHHTHPQAVVAAVASFVLDAV